MFFLFVLNLPFSPFFKINSPDGKTSSFNTVLGRFSPAGKRKSLPAETPQTGCF